MQRQRRKYKTRQRELIDAYLAKSSERYLSIDEIWTGISAEGADIGRSTIYRCLEGMAAEGIVLKATSPNGEARYRISPGNPSGQLVCLACGKALPLDCHMVSEFSAHVLEHHAFRIDPFRTVLYGLCQNCFEAKR